tara:strand:+ start:145 stop:510 length:366 start_codon:yes stop_codon:yes gene_type:complete
MANLITQVTLDRANRKKDKSVSLTFITQLEQSSEQFMEIDELLGDSGVIMFKSGGNLTTEEVKALDGIEIEVEGKSQSKKIRNKIWVLWNKLNTNKSSNDFYKEKTEKILDYLQREIDSLE